MSTKLVALGIAAAATAILASASLFTVNQTQQALVLQLGEWKRTIQEPGLHAKIPFVQNVVLIDSRVLDVDPPVEQVILADQKRLEVDAFARYRITEPLKFYTSVGNENVAEQRLAATVNSALRRVLGNATLLAVLSKERAKVMTDIKAQVNQEAAQFGVEIVDVRIRRADLPEATSQAVYERMRSEREREAREARAQGNEQAQQIRSRAERERTVILAEAQRDSQVLRGEGDNQAIRILAESANKNPDFYSFYRSLDAYKASMKGDNTQMVLSPDSEFFRYFNSTGTVTKR
ncbi:protease modulator HflC [Niveispirillum cyanobacteriorum]|uniref:Protein HflC n=1 Tax=Niveispirillum cyanobacteriorum TaxID=1612173 RepID=A0A2K9NAT2_9PROT|nr:protease modulator HflC [Niveispirillum cyanobacteriorum]AUN30197.1 protease modulator HflC [Niveispirillum cyanobacteriorum]GGE56969.1 protein HflC [Niveispirillum cyanobacteriorum]